MTTFDGFVAAAPFGRAAEPTFPPALASLVAHARSLSEVLQANELCPPRDETAAAWTTGRASEVQRLLEHVAERWASAAIGEDDACALVAAYLRELHHGLRVHLGSHTPRCCLEARAARLPYMTTVEARAEERTESSEAAGSGSGSDLDATIVANVADVLKQCEAVTEVP
jgi:hypothetical protein